MPTNVLSGLIHARNSVGNSGVAVWAILGSDCLRLNYAGTSQRPLVAIACYPISEMR